MRRNTTAAGTAVKDGIAGILTGLNEIEAEIASLVRTRVSNTLRATGTVAIEGLAETKVATTSALPTA
ncbi:MAG: hypothetical protein AB7G75_12885 [Candidatus Binatia bacterium]